jgi:RNA polymerase sigma-70 factor (ECF subfamily)
VAKHVEDLKLVERMLAGEEKAFETFGERCFKAVYRFALARLHGDRDLTLEMVQTATVKALSKLDTYRGEASLPTWLCSCCRNEILMHWRRRRAAPTEVELDEDMETAPGDAFTALLKQEETHRVHLALDLLPEHYARALEWKYVERVPVDEIAARMGVQPKAAESLLTRARHAFRTSYENL